MKKRLFLLFLVVLTVIFTLASCNEKEEEMVVPTVGSIKELAEVQADGTLYFEWLRAYDATKPILVVFHGEENAESHFTINLSKNVYTSDVLGSSFGGGFKVRTTENEYDMGYYWMNVAQYNVAVFHWERFSDESDPESIIAKIFSTYKSRYKKDGAYKNASFSYSLADVVFAVYKKEMEEIGYDGKELRFVGAGTGALLAQAVATKTIQYESASICPYRVALCDAPISTDMVTFETSWINASSHQGTIGLVSAMNKMLIKYGVAIEVYETKEVSSGSSSYAYNYKNGSRESFFSELKNDVAYLEIAESYSLDPIFDVYKEHRRIAFDWYVYSIIGSDDDTVGCSTINDSQDLSVNNRGSNDSRPILNERMISNADPKGRGRNYGLSAWTPTTYVRALRGISFSQKTSAAQNGYDVHGKEKYAYREEYVLKKFSSENYQVSDMRSYSVLCGYVYNDKNKNDRLDDGVGRGRDNGEMVFTLSSSTETEDTVIFEKQSVFAGEDGFYVIRFEDATGNESLRVRSEKGLFVVSGVSCKDQSLKIDLSFKYTLGISSYYSNPVGGLFYSAMSGNNFTKNKYTAYLTKDTVHSIIIGNCTYIDLE